MNIPRTFKKNTFPHYGLFSASNSR